MKNDNQLHAALAGVIRSVRNQNPGLDKALLELIDNSVDARATQINIREDEGDLIISDNGDGFTNIVRALDYGYSEKEDQIGRYGVGMKHCCARYSNVTTITSNGEKVTANWELIAEGTIDTVDKQACDDGASTDICLGGFRDRYKWPIKTDRIRRVYAPFLKSKKHKITVNGKDLEPLPTPTYSKTIDETFSYQGKSVRLRGGIFDMDDPMRKEWYGYNTYYMGRLIGDGRVTTSGVGDEFICTNFCFTLDLEDGESEAWMLATLKDNFEGAKELLDYCYTKYTRELLKEAAEKAKELDLINTENLVNQMLQGGNQRRKNSLGKTGTIEPKNTGAAKQRTFTDDASGEYQARGQSSHRGGMMFKMDKLGAPDIGLMTRHGKAWIFTANLDNAWVKRNERNADALYGMARAIWSTMRVLQNSQLVAEDILDDVLKMAGVETNRSEDF